MSTREERFADHIADLRRKNPMLPGSYWEDWQQKQRMQWQMDDILVGIARLVGAYGWLAEQDPGNTRLAELVAALDDLLKSSEVEAGVVSS